MNANGVLSDPGLPPQAFQCFIQVASRNITWFQWWSRIIKPALKLGRNCTKKNKCVAPGWFPESVLTEKTTEKEKQLLSWWNPSFPVDFPLNPVRPQRATAFGRALWHNGCSLAGAAQAQGFRVSGGPLAKGVFFTTWLQRDPKGIGMWLL